MDLQELTKLYDFTGRAFVITGGAGILGGEIACALVGCGANVAILDRAPELAERLIKRIAQMSQDPASSAGDKPGIGRAVVVYADVLDKATLIQAEQVILSEFGGIYALINAAGGNRPEATTGPERPFFDLPQEALKFAFDLNLLGTIVPSQVFGRTMAEQGEGVILNFASLATFCSLTRVVAYSAAKAAVGNFTQWLAVHMAREYSPRIRVNAVAPGFFITEQNRYLLTDQATGGLTARGQSVIAHTPMQRFGSPEDLLGGVLWLLSPAAAFVSGIVLPIDGGFLAANGI
jgi:NAD(P)-dependent dehydrogenase (short-subunit alcohol dehydrogenase family)